MFWTESFMADVRSYIADRANKLQYHANDQWQDAEILKKEVYGKNIMLTVMISAEETFTIDGIRITDTAGSVIAQTAENIVKSKAALTVEWIFPVYEI